MSIIYIFIHYYVWILLHHFFCNISDEIFLTGTAAEITPVISMDSIKIGTGKAGDITKKMMQEYWDIVMNKNIDYAHWLTEVYNDEWMKSKGFL